MNTETNQENITPMTTGERLRQARKQLGLSQQMVAERLCLMLSTVRDIEEDRLSADLAATFVRGYIRSYAKLVQLPEEKVLPLLTQEMPVSIIKAAPMQSFSLRKKRKNRDGWLMIFTWLIMFVVVGLTGAWWWQNHKVQQREIAEMTHHSTVQIRQNSQQGDLGLNEEQKVISSPVPEIITQDSHATASPAKVSPAPDEQGGTNTASTLLTPETVLNTDALQAQLPVSGVAAQPSVAKQDLQIHFSADCWIEVYDATGKVLVSTLQRKDSSLDLTGQAPYKLKLGVPSAVQIHYQGNLVDLGRIAKSNHVVRLTIPVQ